MTSDDLSYNKIATQSHTFTGTGYDASNAVDGNTATCMRSKDIGRNSLYKTVWWKVDLGEIYSLHSVNIIFRNYLEYGLCFIEIYEISYCPKRLMASFPFLKLN